MNPQLRTVQSPNGHAEVPAPAERLAETDELLQRYRDERTPAVRTELVERFMPLARRLASRYRGGPESIEDLVQVASIGLIQAIERFDPGRGTAFSSFAVPTILGELRRHFRDRGWSVRVPRDLQERVARVERAAAELPAEIGHAPSVEEIASHLKVSDDDVLEAMHAAYSHHAVSLDAAADEANERSSLMERLGSDDTSFEVVEYGASIEDALDELSERDRRVLHMRFVDDMTQSRIAERIGVSQMHVSRILRGALEHLRNAIETDRE